MSIQFPWATQRHQVFPIQRTDVETGSESLRYQLKTTHCKSGELSPVGRIHSLRNGTSALLTLKMNKCWQAFVFSPTLQASDFSGEHDAVQRLERDSRLSDRQTERGCHVSMGQGGLGDFLD